MYLNYSKAIDPRLISSHFSRFAHLQHLNQEQLPFDLSKQAI
jgi:hypothetical protein